jgi:hypothetical protein
VKVCNISFAKKTPNEPDIYLDNIYGNPLFSAFHQLYASFNGLYIIIIYNFPVIPVNYKVLLVCTVYYYKLISFFIKHHNFCDIIVRRCTPYCQERLLETNFFFSIYK